MGPSAVRGPAPPASEHRADVSSFARQAPNISCGTTTVDLPEVNMAALALFPAVLARILAGGNRATRSAIASGIVEAGLIAARRPHRGGE
jgi:hypothetical protein